MWNEWKKGFDLWENATAKLVEEWMKSPFVLGPAGAMLTAAMKAKKATDDAKAQLWGQMGLPTKRDQERALHLLNQLQSRIMDLEEKLESRG
ncbi:MAG: hypothetical protein ABSE49_02365 [Polyangiaceae bacterium]|jgi:hypothetical protein